MNIALIGYGKMGQEIEKILLNRGHNISLIIDANNISDFTQTNFSNIDVAIEFSTPEVAYHNIVKCINFGVPIVSGTTAWLDKYEEVINLTKEKNGTFFYASNYSIGVNIMFKLNKELASMMDKFTDYDVTLNEVHHNQKLDAPSGTAITLANGILDGCSRKHNWKLGANTTPSILEITSQRRSIVPGIHTVVWDSPVDTITIDHSAKNRDGFAMGAVLAAEFVARKKGVYTMSDMLGF